MAIGLAAGFAETAIMLWQKHYSGRMGLNPHHVWMTPLLYTCATLIIGGVLSALHRLAPRLVPWRLAVAVPLGLCFASVVGLSVSGLHAAALTILAGGAGLQGAGMLSSRPAFAARGARLIVTVLGLATVAAWVSIRMSDRARERRAIAALPPPTAGAVSVLLLVLDTVGAQHLGLYGYARQTSPQLERWGKRGVVFERAIATAPWTLPSHVTMMTGLYPHEFAYDWLQPAQTASPMLAEAFRDHGYVTGGFAGNWIYLSPEYGLARGFARYEAASPSPGIMVQQAWLLRQVVRSPRLRRFLGTDEDWARPRATSLNESLLEWLAAERTNRPFFAFVNYFDAHRPYVPPRDIFRRIAGYEKTDDLDPLSHYTYESRRNAKAGEIKLARDAHDASIAALDGDVGSLLSEMESRGMLRNTVVIITSDHGEEFGENGVYYHGHTVHAPAIHVPLVMFGPGVPAGVRVTETVSLRDLASTVASLANLRGTPSFPGSSFVSLWEDGPVAVNPSPALSETKRGIRIPDRYPNARHDAQSIMADTWHYIRVQGEKQQLYDWFADPTEQHDLIGTPRGDSIARVLGTLLSKHRAAPAP